MSTRTIHSIEILMAEDDIEDQMLVRDAFREAHLSNRLETVSNGEQLIAYLRCSGPYQAASRPDLILLDLNMPRMDGREALELIKSHADFKTIPVVVLTTSGADEDIVRSYDLGVNSYIRKPVTFEKLVKVVSALSRYWFEIVELPPNEGKT